ncbi:MAG: DUF72 domain-containing protein [Thermoactinomyces sp.]
MGEIINPIQVGLCGWGDHDLYPPHTKAKDKLAVYAGHFPVVEVDTTFYAIAPRARMERWSQETPASFRFVVKAYQELTGHGRIKGAPVRTWQKMVQETKDSVAPLVEAGKLQMLLFQFPPWFDCVQKHVKYIRRIREAFYSYPVAIEFRHQSWYQPGMMERTLDFLRKEELIHTICDEPQAGEGSIPPVIEATHPQAALIRFHGRNMKGWKESGRTNWRDVRYAYCYSDTELDKWARHIQTLSRKVGQITVLFNNNSEGDAAKNARQMIRKLNLDFKGLSSRQLTFFDEI